MEEVRAEQLLMLTFSRSAATEFKIRLHQLVGNAAGYVDIKTFHAFCFDLLGKRGNSDRLDTVIAEAIARIRADEVEPAQITRTVVVIDEAQDMNAQEMELVQALIAKNEEMRLIAVGDDDQSIFAFRGAHVGHLQAFFDDRQARVYELLENYRSAHNLVAFSGQVAATISHRLKTTPSYAHTTENGELRLIRYQTRHLVVPLVQDLDSMSLRGTTAILTKTNAEAFSLLGALRQAAYPARLIQSNDGFNLFNLYEVRCFWNAIAQLDASPKIDDCTWEESRRILDSTCPDGPGKDLARQIIADFGAANPQRKFRSDLEMFFAARSNRVSSNGRCWPKRTSRQVIHKKTCCWIYSATATSSNFWICRSLIRSLN
ncbi:MAG: hypothetical protein OHK0039_33650 [Bacteroidia bacterium]